MKTFLLGGVAAAILATVAPSFAQAPAPARIAKTHTRADVTARVQKQFARIDANRDGAITQAEAA
ncbi:MAG TPA: calcium-binding protein, partial [Sphingomicrobium sp.]